MDEKRRQGRDIVSHDETVVDPHLQALECAYQALPTCGSVAFWIALECPPSPKQEIPVEVLVRVLREQAPGQDDPSFQHRLCEIIFARLQEANEQWVQQALFTTSFPPGERHMLAADLYADLCEQLLRELLYGTSAVWQERFFSCLRFLRNNVFKRFLRREGCWCVRASGRERHIPAKLVESLEKMDYEEEKSVQVDLPDERAERELLAVEQPDLLGLLLNLPEEQRAVIWLVYWEDRAVEQVSKALTVSKRVVYYRLEAALKKLRRLLEVAEVL